MTRVLIFGLMSQTLAVFAGSVNVASAKNLSIHTSDPMKSAKMRFGIFAVAAAAIVPCAANAMDIKAPSVHVASPHITITPHLSTPQSKSATSQESNVPVQGRFKNEPDNGSNVPVQGRFKNEPGNGSNVPPQGRFKNEPGNGSNVPVQGRFKNDPDNGSNVPVQGRFKNEPSDRSNVPPQGPISNAPGSGSASTQGSITATGSGSYQGSTR
jgi:hypothetical protein